MIGRGVLACCLLLPLSAAAQGGLRDTPRALDVFSGLSGYADLPSERYGTLANPAPTELGMVLVSRMFRTVCLGIEAGQPLEAVMPDGFAAHPFSVWLMGTASDRAGGAIVLSSTGDIARDEDEGHPSIELRPDDGGMTCRVNWHIPGGVEPERAAPIADLIAQWLPWEYALIDADRPEFATDPSMSRLHEWDRPCGARWCAMRVLQSLDLGQISMETTLNRTDIEGTLP